MTTIRTYNDSWDGAVHAHRAAPAIPGGTPRGWLEGPIAPRRHKPAGKPVATAPAPGTTRTKPRS